MIKTLYLLKRPGPCVISGLELNPNSETPVFFFIKKKSTMMEGQVAAKIETANKAAVS